MAERTFFVNPPHPSRFTTFIKGGDAYHLYKVLRKRIGDTVHCLDSAGTAYLGEIVAIKKVPLSDNHTTKVAKSHLKLKEAWELVLKLTIKEESPEKSIKLPELTVWISMPHPRTLASLTAKLSECGVYALQPIITERSFFHDPHKINLPRFRKIAEEAQKHSGRKDSLEIRTPRLLSELLSDKASQKMFQDSTYTNILLWENEPYFDANLDANSSFSTNIFSQQLPKDDFAMRKINLVIGPEGGITFTEHSELVQAGFKTASLHPYILKVETAVLFAVAQCFAL